MNPDPENPPKNFLAETTDSEGGLGLGLTADRLVDILDEAEGDGIIGPDYTPQLLADYILESLETLSDRRTRYLAQAIVDNVNFDEDSGQDGNLCRYCILVMPNHEHDCAFVIATEVLGAPED